MERIWAPWRGEYINSQSDNSKCILCDLLSQKPSDTNLILYSTKYSFVVLNKFPYNNGHIMVVPKKHTSNFNELTKREFEDLNNLIKTSVNVINKTYHPQGINIGLNMGRAAGAGIDTHIHYHIVPRWNGDSNFMPIISDTKIISEHILETYKKLKKAFKELEI